MCMCTNTLTERDTKRVTETESGRETVREIERKGEMGWENITSLIKEDKP